MKYTNENKNIMHEVGHFLMYTLYLTTNKRFDKKLFTSKIIELSIVPNPEENTAGHLTTVDNISKVKNRLCRSYTLLSGVLFSTYLVEHNWNCEFSKIKEIEHNFVHIYCDHGGGSDLESLVTSDRSMTFHKTAVYIQELKKIMFDLWDNEVIRKIMRQLYRGLQKNKCMEKEKLFNIIEPHIPELKKLGKQIYNAPNKFRLDAKALLF